MTNPTNQSNHLTNYSRYITSHNANTSIHHRSANSNRISLSFNLYLSQEVVVGQKHIYLVFPPCHGDMHCYVRTRRRLREPNARHLFRQIVAAVHEAHIKGIVLRDLKLRKFVFTDESR